jgi:hypothetical protein
MARTDQFTHPRLAREARTVDAMVALYCRANHGGDVLCGECAALREYARARLRHCPFGADKGTCAKCPVHCYGPDMREHMRLVMRYAGPRMLAHHPVLALRHVLDGRRRPATRD